MTFAIVLTDCPARIGDVLVHVCVVALLKRHERVGAAILLVFLFQDTR